MPRAASADGRARSVRGISPGAVAGSDGGFPSLDSLLIQLSAGSVPVGYRHATRVGLFGELLNLLPSGLDLCCRTCAVLGTCQHLEGACPQGASVQPLSSLFLSPEGSQRKDRSLRDIPDCLFRLPTWPTYKLLSPEE